VHVYTERQQRTEQELGLVGVDRDPAVLGHEGPEGGQHLRGTEEVVVDPRGGRLAQDG